MPIGLRPAVDPAHQRPDPARAARRTALPTPVTFEAPAEPIEVAHGFGASIADQGQADQGSRRRACGHAAAAAPGPGGAGGHDRREVGPGHRRGQHRARGPAGAGDDRPSGQGEVRRGRADDRDSRRDAEPGPSGRGRPRARRPSRSSRGPRPRSRERSCARGRSRSRSRSGSTACPRDSRPTRSPWPPGAADFAIKVVAEAKAAAASAAAQLVSAYQVNKKDYPTTAVPLAVKVLPAK